MILSDQDIHRCIADGEIEIDPFDPEMVQPASVDLRLDQYFRVFHPGRYECIDPKLEQAELTEVVFLADDDAFILHPGEFVIGSSVELIGIGNGYVGRLDGKSSLGRLGLLVHATAGFFDPGFRGQATLELLNVTRLPIKLYPNMPIGQMSFMKLMNLATNPYGSAGKSSKYQGQRGPTASRYFENFKEEANA